MIQKRKIIRFILFSLSNFFDIKFLLFLLGRVHKKFKGMSRKKVIYLDFSKNKIESISNSTKTTYNLSADDMNHTIQLIDEIDDSSEH